MPIVLRLDRVMADRKMSLNALAEKVGIANVNEALHCQPGDILEYMPPQTDEDGKDE